MVVLNPPMEADGAIPCGHMPHPYNPICTAQAGALSFRRWQVGTYGWARLGMTRSDVLNTFDRPQSAIEERYHVHSGELEAGKAGNEQGFRRFNFHRLLTLEGTGNRKERYPMGT